MRKLSELLRICSEYNSFFYCDSLEETISPPISHATASGMCISALLAYRKREISFEELNLVRDKCAHLVEEVLGRTLIHTSYLHLALSTEFNLEEDKIGQYVRMVYNAWIDKLDSEGN